MFNFKEKIVMKNIQKFFAALKRRACLYALWGKASECEAFPIRARGGKQGAVCIGHTAEKRASRAARVFIPFYRLCFGLSLLVYSLSLGHCANVKGKVFGGDGNFCSFSEKASTFREGTGDEDNPYVIYTCPELALISDDIDAHYKLGRNINASGGDWTPIGDNTNQFTGSLDGNGYLIRNLTVDISEASGDAYGGFFGYIDSSNAVISNIALPDVSVTVNQNSATANTYVGGLVGRISNGTISNSYAAGAVTVTSSGTSVDAVVDAGGLVGHNDGTINNGYTGASVTIRTQRSKGRVGGLVGSSGGTINNSYATGRATCDGSSCSGVSLGGLVGRNNSAGVNASYWDTVSTATNNGCGDHGSGCLSVMGLITMGMQTVTTDPTTSPIGLGLGFQFSAGSYPKLKLCTVCTGAFAGFEYSDELLPAQ